MTIIVRKTQDKETAYQIAESLPHYFNKLGLSKIKEAVEDGILYGAYIDNRMVGFLTYKILNPAALELSWMGIVSDYHGKGIGTELVTKSLREMSGEYKLCEVKTLADTVNDKGYSRTRSFYKKLGFIPLEIIDPYPTWEKNSPCLIMVKPIK